MTDQEFGQAFDEIHDRLGVQPPPLIFNPEEQL